MTAPRRAVIEAMVDAGAHIHPAELLSAGRIRFPKLGRATVYRMLETLSGLGVIRPLHLGDGGVSYTWNQGGHHHLVCSDCGTVVEFDDCIVGPLETKLKKRLGFQIKSHLLEFYGTCRSCTAS